MKYLDSRQNCAKCGNKFGLTGVVERYYTVCPECKKEPFHIIVYPDYDDWGNSVLYYVEYIRGNVPGKVICKVYKRQWYPYARTPSADAKTLEDYFTNEVHPFVLFEFYMNESTEPRQETVNFMVDAMNEKWLKTKN